MKLGVRAHDFGRMGAGQLARMIKAAGYEALQLAPTKAIEGIHTFGDITEAKLLEIDTAFREEVLDISVLGCYIEPSVTDREQRLGNVAVFNRGLENAKKIGIPIVGTETTHFPQPDEKEREQVYQLLKDSVMRMAEKAEREEVLVGIEPVADHTLNTPELTRRLLDEVGSDKVKVVFDPSNLLLPETIADQGRIFDQVFKLLGNDIAAVHVKDIVIEDGHKKMVPIGQGLVDFKSILPRLKANAPGITLLRENADLRTNQQDIETIKKYWYHE